MITVTGASGTVGSRIAVRTAVEYVWSKHKTAKTLNRFTGWRTAAVDFTNAAGYLYR